MKIRFLITLLALTVFSTAASADLRLGVKAGPMLVSFDDVETDENPRNVGLSAGYHFNLLVGEVGLEAEITRSISEGDVVGTSLEVESQGVYLTYTSPGLIYFKGKLGFMDASLVAGDLSEDEGGETYGLGVGMSLGLVNIEIEYTAIDDDVSFVSLGLVF